MTASSAGSSRSRCQTRRGSAPSARSAQNASRSSFDPGKTSTPTRGRTSGIAYVDLVALDEGVGEQPLAHALDLGARRRGTVGLDLQIDDAADAGVGHREAELAKRALDGLALGIEDPLLRAHEYGCLHRSTVSGSARYSSNGIPVSRSKAST